MSFPGNFNIQYYKGDTYEFRVYPKDSSGAAFDLTGYANEDINFTISDRRGAAGIPAQVECFSEKATDGSHILCTIRPADGNQLSAGTGYVYDVEIKTTQPNSYELVYTLLTGNVSVTDQVTGAV
jgi:putative aminopeptidase FrvX